MTQALRRLLADLSIIPTPLDGQAALGLPTRRESFIINQLEFHVTGV